MTKGKYGTRAALRRESTEVQSEIATYQAAVRRLTADNKRLREELIREKAGHQEDIRILKAQLNEGLSPELSAMQRRYHEQSERITKMKASLKRDHELWHKYTKRFQRYLVEQHQIKQKEAAEITHYLASDDCDEITWHSAPEGLIQRWRKEAGGWDGMEKISQARGYISPPTPRTLAAINIAIEDQDQGK